MANMNRPKRVTMRDIAPLAGVGVMTVSRVLAGKPGAGPETREAVERAAKTLGYRKHGPATILRTGQRLGWLALIVNDISNPFYGVIADAVDTVARSAGYFLVVACTKEDPSIEREIVEGLLARHVDGLVLVSADTDHSYLSREMAAGTGVVFLDRPPSGIAADTVLPDNEAGARGGVECLIKRGHKRIAFLGGFEHIYSGRTRFEGYRLALQSAGLYDPSLVRWGLHDADAVVRALPQLLDGEAPTGIFGSNNVLAIAAAHEVRLTDRPVDILGFDDLPRVREAMIDFVAFDAGRMGTSGARMLLEQLKGGHRPPRRVIVPTRLIERRVAARRSIHLPAGRLPAELPV